MNPKRKAQMRRVKTRCNLSLLSVAFILLFDASANAQPTIRTSDIPVINGIYFAETGCSHCDIFLYSEKKKIEQKYGVLIQLETHDILSEQGYELCVKMLEAKHLKFTIFPVLFIGSNVYEGNAAIEDNLPQEIEYYLAHVAYMPKIEQPNISSSEKPTVFSFASSLIPTLFAGLLDGINPCAFSTMLFFLSFIALRRSDRRSLLMVGITFIAAVFIAYFLIGLGLLEALRKFFSEKRFTIYVNIFVSAMAVIFAFFNLRDAHILSQGRSSDVALQLPLSLKKLNHAVIRYFNRLPLYVLGAGISGFLVAIIELACTGQIYLPTIAYMNRNAPSTASIGLLVAYNLAFIFPLTIVFVLYLLGMHHEKLRQWYSDHLATVKIATALFFIMLGILVWII